MLGARDADQRALGLGRERPLSALGERFGHCDPGYVLRERACSACGTVLQVDMQHASEPALEGARLRGGAGGVAAQR